MIIPHPEIDPDKIKMIMISEAPPADFSDYYYQKKSGSFFLTTRMAFEDAGYKVASYNDLTELGIYLTTAIKCRKKEYLVSLETIRTCANILEKEISQFPNIRVIMCMGDFAIKSINFIFKRKYGTMPIPRGSTYKIRKETHHINDIRFFPSYTQTGDSFNLEKSKRRMIAEDIKNAMDYLNKN
jgi:uracil-DNA glycosylase